MNNNSVIRTASIVAAEINAIKQQTIQTVYYASIEIGRRLLEAKTLVDHGDWCKWLEENVEYSKTKANNLMKICLEFDDGQQDLFMKMPKSHTYGNLNYSQMVALLALPETDREEFVEEKNIDDMSVRELQKAIKERDEALAEKAKLEKENTEFKSLSKTAADDIKREKEKAKTVESKFNTEMERLRSLLKQADEKIKTVENQKTLPVEDDEDDIDEETEENTADIPVVDNSEYEEKIAQLEIEKAELERKISASSSDTEFQKLLALFEMFQENYNKMLKIIEKIQISKPESAEKIKPAIKKVLASMSEKI